MLNCVVFALSVAAALVMLFAFDLDQPEWVLGCALFIVVCFAIDVVTPRLRNRRRL